MSARQDKKVRKLVREHLSNSKTRVGEFVTLKLATMRKPWYIPRLIWTRIVKRIILEFTSDSLI